MVQIAVVLLISNTKRMYPLPCDAKSGTNKL